MKDYNYVRGILLTFKHELLLETPRASFRNTRGAFQLQLWQSASEHSGSGTKHDNSVTRRMQNRVLRHSASEAEETLPSLLLSKEKKKKENSDAVKRL